jgi:predicted RNA-binding protein with PIN domain
VHVATDDHLEQTIAFAKGAYRITARELWLRVNQEKKESKTHTTNDRKIAGGSSIGDRLDAAQKALFEKWRRENK